MKSVQRPCVPDELLPNAGPEESEDLKAVSGKSGQQADRGMVLPFEPLAMSFSHMWCADCDPPRACLDLV